MKNNPIIYSDKIFYYKNAISNPEKLVQDIENHDVGWSSWESSNKDTVFGMYKNLNLNQADPIAKEIYKGFEKARLAYFDKTNKFLNKILDIRVAKYFPEVSMGPHTDKKAGSFMSAVMYLNDDYESGEIHFPDFDVLIKPQAGSIVIFPSDVMHDPKPAFLKERYIVPYFWYK
jgi:hypothetical protein